jgi:hypothetical protein
MFECAGYNSLYVTLLGLCHLNYYMSIWCALNILSHFNVFLSLVVYLGLNALFLCVVLFKDGLTHHPRLIPIKRSL